MCTSISSSTRQSVSLPTLHWHWMLAMVLLIIATVHLVAATAAAAAAVDPIDCSRELRMGQFICPDPDRDYIDTRTQQPIGCTPEGKAKVWCLAADGLVCSDTRNASFLGDIPCNWT